MSTATPNLHVWRTDSRRGMDQARRAAIAQRPRASAHGAVQAGRRGHGRASARAHSRLRRGRAGALEPAGGRRGRVRGREACERGWRVARRDQERRHPAHAPSLGMLSIASTAVLGPHGVVVCCAWEKHARLWRVWCGVWELRAGTGRAQMQPCMLVWAGPWTIDHCELRSSGG
eukprot:673029-Rhodomonas_salina.1